MTDFTRLQECLYSADAETIARDLKWLGKADKVAPLLAAAPAGGGDEWRSAVLDHLAVACMDAPKGEPPYKIIGRIIDWHVQVATDPAVNGGFALTPIATPAAQPEGLLGSLSQSQLDEIVGAYLHEQNEGGSLWACIQSALNAYDAHRAIAYASQQRARVEVTDAMVERACVAISHANGGEEWPDEFPIQQQTEIREAMRAALTAAIAAGEAVSR